MRRLVQTVGSALPWLIPGIFGAAWYLAIGGGRTLAPTNVWWMLEGDWFCYLFSWLFYRNEPWSLPLGDLPDLIHPFGTSVGLTDSLPLLNSVGKLLSPVLPEQFQLYGLWMCSGFVVMGIVGSRLVARVSNDRLLQAMGGIVLAVSPILSTRYGHPPFSALWAIFGLIGLALLPRPGRAWGDQRQAWGFLFFACATHPYLAAMALPIAMAVAARAVLLKEVSGPRQTSLILAAPMLVAIATLWFFGYLSSLGKVQGGAEGFGEFSADLTTFANPVVWSRFFGNIPIGPRQYEGFAYLGLGGFVLALTGVVWLVRLRKGLLSLLPLLLVVLAMAFYSLSNVITFGGHQVADLRWLYAKLGSLPSMFRSSGRFIWPLHGLLVVSGVSALARLSLRNRGSARALLGLAMVAQLADINFSSSTLPKPGPHFEPLRAAAWNDLGHDYRHLAVIPVQISWYSPFDGPLIGKLSWLAYQQKMSINSGHVGRPPQGLVWDKHPSAAELDPQTVYVVYFREYLSDFLQAGWTCGPLERMVVCVSASRDTALRSALVQSLERREPAELRPMR
jgi:hypothetical protein